MDPVLIGLSGFGLVLVLLALRVPIAFALLGVASGGIFLIYAFRGGVFAPERAINPTGSAVMSNFFDLIHSYDLSMIPLFIALGNVAWAAGMTTRIYDAANVWLRGVPGGVGMASVLGCAGFSAISGSSVACASTMGRICVPEMLRMGYDPRLATASIAAGGTLGSLIPPSVLFILYGIFTETSINALFMAGIVPGLVTLAGYLAVIWIWVRHSPQAAPVAGQPVSATQKWQAAWGAGPAILIAGVVIGGIYGGVFTATEAAAVSLCAAAGVGLGQGSLTWGGLWRAIRGSLIQTSSIFLIAAGAKVFVGFIALTGAAGVVVDWVGAAGLGPVAMMVVLVGVYLLLGMFLDPVGILVLTLPFAVPMVEDAGIGLVWFGVVVIKLLEIGLITPPVGLNIFVIGNVAHPRVPGGVIVAGIWRFWVADLVVVALLIAFPALSTCLPAFLG